MMYDDYIAVSANPLAELLFGPAGLIIWPLILAIVAAMLAKLMK